MVLSGPADLNGAWKTPKVNIGPSSEAVAAQIINVKKQQNQTTAVASDLVSNIVAAQNVESVKVKSSVGIGRGFNTGIQLMW